MADVKPIPEGYHSLTPYLSLRNCKEAIEFYVRAFGAKERARMLTPDGKVMHAEIQIGDSIVMLSEAVQEPPSVSTLYLYVPDVGAAHARAVKAGATPTMPVTDMFWGDRFGPVADPFGIKWLLATHKEDLAGDEIERRQAEFMKQQAR
jgi:uncharacterized glyoxalase superfamily protein PhnB